MHTFTNAGDFKGYTAILQEFAKVTGNTTVCMSEQPDWFHKFVGVKSLFSVLKGPASLLENRASIATTQASPHIAPVPRKLVPDRCGWAPGWTEDHSRSYGVREAQAQA